ncbi:YoaH family protein [Ursidibacter sp. B-7004-1]
MDNTLLSLTHEQQQQAVEQIQQLMQQGISSGEAIALVAQELKEKYRQEHHQTIIPKENKEYE